MIERLARAVRNRSWRESRSRPRGKGAAGRLPLALLSVAIAVAAMSQTAVQAQVYISNNVPDNAILQGKTSGTVGSQGTLHFVQPFTTPAAIPGRPFVLESVVLHFSRLSVSLMDVKLYLYRGRANPHPDDLEQLFAPTVPDAGTIDPTTHALPENDPGKVLEFATATSLGSDRYRFAAPANSILDESTTYHLYLWSIPNNPGPRWKMVDIANSDGPPGDWTFTGHTAECPGSGDWALLRGLSNNPMHPFDDGWVAFPTGSRPFVTEIVGRPNDLPSKPTITGDRAIGSELTVDTSIINDDNGLPSSFTYQWYRVDFDLSNPEAISGATSRTYTPTEADEDKRLRVQVTYTDNDCYTQTTSAEATANTFATGLEMGGKALVGETLTAMTGNVTDRNGLPDPVSFTYRWTRVDADGKSNPEAISGATSPTYTLVEADHDKRVRVTVSFADAKGNAEELSALSDEVSASATGLTLGGEALVGETLTAETDGIEDLDGLSSPSFTFRWAREDADGTSDPEVIAGATSSTYELVEADHGKRVRVTVSFADDDGNAEELSVLSDEVFASATGLTLGGEALVGETLTAETDGIKDLDGLSSPSFTFRWTREDADGTSDPEAIAGATSSTYELVEADHDKRVRVTLSFADDDGNAEELSVLSDEVSASATGLTLGGEALVGETLTAETDGIKDLDGLSSPSFIFRWTREDADGTSDPEVIAGATSSTYELVEADHGKRVRVTLSFADDDGNAEELSVLSDEVSASATGLTLGGEALVGETLTAETDGIKDLDGLSSPSFTFRWTREDADGTSDPEVIAGATSSTYELVEADHGKRVRVTVSFADDDGNAEELSVLSDEVFASATGLTLGGEALVGETLTAETDGIKDLDGLSSPSFTFRWTRVNADGTSDLEVIAGATSSTYELVEADHGKRVRVTVSFADDDGNAEELSVLSDKVSASATGLTLGGEALVGETLTAETDGIEDLDGLSSPSFTFRWTRVNADGTSDPEVIAGATSSTHELVEADHGKRVRVTVNFADDDGNAEELSVLSDEVSASATGLTLGGEALVGETLTAETDGIEDLDGLSSPSFTFQWTREDADGTSDPEVIAGAMSSTHELVEADHGKRVRVTVSFADDDGNAEELSVLSDGVSASATGLTLGGEALVGETLTAETDGIEDLDGLSSPSFTYRWTRLDADGMSNPEVIAGAMSSTYELVEADHGKRVRVTLSFADDDGNAEELSVLSDEVSASSGGLAMSGKALVGETLTAETDGIEDLDGLSSPSFTFRWTREDADGMSDPEVIVGATSPTYELVEADHGKRVRVTVSFADDDGNAEELNVLSDEVSASAGGLAMSGKALVGETLTAETDGIEDLDGLSSPSFTYRWTRLDADGSNPEDIAGATGATYALVKADHGKRVRVTVSFADTRGNAEELSALSGEVSASATGLAISGKTLVGETLTAETGGIADLDGLSSPSFTFRWTREDADGMSDPEVIAGATDATYALVEADHGKRVRVTVSFADNDGNAEELSALSDEVSASAGGLAMSGKALVGETLTAETGGIADLDGLSSPSFTFRWTREDADGMSDPEVIAGATSSTYELVEADHGKRVRVTVSFADNDGNAEELSALSDEVSASAGGLAMSGKALVGETLTAETGGIADLDGLSSPSFTFQWTREDADGTSDPEDIAGATGVTYELVEADHGKRVRVTVSFADARGNAEELSALSDEVSASAGGLAMSGETLVGETLTAETGGIADLDGLSPRAFTFRWTRVGADGTSNPEVISGATSPTYELVEADHGKRVRVTVSFADADGNAEELSALSDEVSASAGGLAMSGETLVGETLTAMTGGIADLDGLSSPSFTFQWTREDADGTSDPEDIAGATGVTYELVEVDHGKRVRVTVSFADARGNAEELSALSDEVSASAGGLAMSGKTLVGETLTAETDGIADLDGLSSPSFAFRWTRLDTDGSNPEVIAGVMSQSYALVEADHGKRVRATVSFDDDDGNAEELSVLSGEVFASAKGLTLGGEALVGEILTAETDNIVDLDGRTGAVFTYRWTRLDADGMSNPEDISDATSPTYTLVDDDRNRRVWVTVSFTDDAGNAETVRSAPSDVVKTEDDVDAEGLEMSGTEQVGEILTAETGGISDGNGLTGAVFAYRWTRVDADGMSNPEEIADATSQTYALVEDDQGRRMRVTVSFEDDRGNAEMLSVLSEKVIPENNVPAEGLALDGTAKVGETLTAMTGGIMDENGMSSSSFTYRWTRVNDDGTSETIAGETSQTCTLAEDDQRRRVRVTVSFLDDDGNAEELSVLSEEVTPEDNVFATGLTLGGTAQVGETLTVETDGILDGNGMSSPSFAYRWTRVNDDGTSETIAGATSQTYSLVEDDQGRRVRATVSFLDDDDNAEELGVLSGEILPEDNVPATGLAMSGRAMVGRTLTAETDGIEDANGPNLSDFTYRWTRLDADGMSNPEDIAGATSRTYTPTEADAGRRLRVTVTFNDNDGNPEELSVLSGVVEHGAEVESRAVEVSLALFGRTVAEQVLTRMKQRFETPYVPGVRTTFAGQHIDWSPERRNPDWGGVAMSTAQALSALSARDLLAGSSFLFSGETAGGGYASVWSLAGAHGVYASEEDGLDIDGSVQTGQVGADLLSGSWMLGASVAHSVGDSDHRYTATSGGSEADASLTGIYPYARYALTERSSVWVAAGRGEGSVELTPEGENARGGVETDIDLTMGAAGLRVEVLQDDEAAGMSLTATADGTYVGMTSDEVTGRLSATSPETHRVRAGLEGSWHITLDGGAALIPSAEFGVRHDGGSVSTGTGADVGAGVVYAIPDKGLSFDLRGRSLIVHEAPGARDWGVSGAFRYDEDPVTERGFATSLDGGYGAYASDGMDALFAPGRFEDLKAEAGTLPGMRLGAEVGYGFPAFGNRFSSRPSASLDMAETGPTWRLGWWITPARPGRLNLSGGIDVNPHDGEYRVGLLLDARF